MTLAQETLDVVDLEEFRTVTRPARPPDPADLRLAGRLDGTDGPRRLTVRWLADQTVEIESYSWVGVVRFTGLEIHVVPKLVGGALGVLRMLDYAAGTHMLRRLPSDRPLPAEGRNLFDLICLLLVEEVAQVLRDGLLRDYRPDRDGLTVLRGRLDYRSQLLRRFGQLQLLDCNFDEYDADIPENQLIAAALQSARTSCRDADIRVHIGQFAAIWNEVCFPATVDPEWYQAQIRYDRRNQRYATAHELSKLVLRHRAVDDLYDTSSGQMPAFMIDMNLVFEKFVARLVEDAIEGTSLRVATQHSLRAVIRNEITNRPYAAVKPDLVIFQEDPPRAVPLDVKYKRYDLKSIAAGDIYQTFLYALALASGEHTPTAGIVYPALSPTEGPRLAIQPLKGPIAARIAGAGIDVPAALRAIEGPCKPQLLLEVRKLVSKLSGLSW